VPLNCLGKLLEKVLAKQMQFDAQACGFTDELQFGGLMMRSTADAGMHVCKHIQEARLRGEDSSAILVDVAQFFPSLDHEALLAILRHYGFPVSRLKFFKDYLSGRSTTFLFNGNTTPPSLFDSGVVQGSALFPFLANIYIAPAIQATKRWLLWTYPEVTLQFYVDDGMIITSCKKSTPKEAWTHNASVLSVVFKTLQDNLLRILLRLEADKTEAIHFTRRRKYKADLPGPTIWLPPERGSNMGTLVNPSTTARYLGIYLDTTLSFRAHQKFYFTKAESTLSTLRMLGNSIRGLNPKDKRRLYIANVLPIMSYCAQLWWCPNWKGNKEAANALQCIQNQAARWISGAFHTTPVDTLNALAGLIPVSKNIDILMRKAALRSKTLPISHLGSLHHARYGAASKDHKLPSYWISIIGSLCEDGPTHMLPCSYPGSHLIDIAETGNISSIHKEQCRVLIAYYEHPKKSALGEFYTWLQAYRNDLDAVFSLPSCTTVYANGGVRTTISNNKNGASAYSICRGNNRGWDFILAEASFKCGLATPFDAEISAAALGIEAAIDLIASEFERESIASPEWHDSTQYRRTLVLCIDNQAAAMGILTGSMKLGHAPAVCTATKVRDYLDMHPRHKFIAMWVPSYTKDMKFGGASMPHSLATRGNDRVDDLCAKCLADRGPMPNTRSKAATIAALKEKHLASWRKDLADIKQRGQKCLLRKKDILRMRHSVMRPRLA
jgi:hypothetical protein